MSGYQRMVSYLYRYEKGIKGKNVGYARIELINDRCRITVRFQDMISISPKMSLFMQQEQGLFPVPAGKLVRNGNSFAGRIETSQSHVAGTDYTFGKMDGIYITGPENVFYATTWKDIVISEQGIPQNAEDSRRSAEVETEIAVPEKMEPVSEKSDSREENIPQKENMPKQEKKHEDAEAEPEELQVEASSVCSEDCGKKMAGQGRGQQDEKMRSREFCEKMLRLFPKMYPFETAGMGECVRIDLKDIGNLPVAYWSLAGNPFLLRGYYCYRHLIFTRMDGGGYAVGVPGIYSEDNGRWAEECRMTQFQPLSQVKDRHGAFGYWMYDIS